MKWEFKKRYQVAKLLRSWNLLNQPLSIRVARPRVLIVGLSVNYHLNDFSNQYPIQDTLNMMLQFPSSRYKPGNNPQSSPLAISIT